MSAHRILLVDDDTALLHVLRDALEHGGFVVATASDGLAALQEAKQFLPDLIISDVMMPKMSGFQLCRSIRASQELCDVPFVLATGKSNPRDRRYAESLGVSAMLAKPFKSQELVDLAANLLHGRGVRATGEEAQPVASR